MEKINALPTIEDANKKAMLRKKTKYAANMENFSSRKNAYKQGWRDCYEWMMNNGYIYNQQSPKQ